MLQNNILLETQFFPTIPYVSAIMQHVFSTEGSSQTLFLEKYAFFQKGTFRNRCQIATAQGTQTLSVPLKKGKNQHQIIKDVQIANDIDWQRPIWRTLQTAYGNAPYWEHYAPVFEPFFSKKYENLFDYNLEILNTIFIVLSRHKPISISFTLNYEAIFTEGVDLRHQFTPKSENLKFKRYPQVFEDRLGFIPHLSILDLLFCCGKQSLDILI